MNAAVLSPAGTAREAHAALHAAMTATWPRERAALKAVVTAFVALGDALEACEELDSGALHWEAVYPHLGDEADPDGEALRKAAEEVEAAAGDLIQAVAEHCGEVVR